jgi:colanic acid/amylovoran biosynthesis glycosyltransferase
VASERSIACVVSRYPAVSHAFIVREVRALRGRGWDVHTFTIRRPAERELLSAADREEAARTFAVLPPRLPRLIAAHLRALLLHPVRYLGALETAVRVSPPGLRSRLWRLFYFVEAILVWRECERRGVRHLHAHFANVGSEVAMLAARFGGSAWSWSFTMHSTTELFDEVPHRLSPKIRSARFVSCSNHFTRAQLMRLIEPEHWSKLHVVRCGVDPGAFRPCARTAARRPVRVLTVARLIPLKGHALLLEAIAALREQGVALQAVFVGDGPERARLEALARSLGLDDEAVEFAGAFAHDELPSHYQRADIACLPTLAEGLPVVLMEAMAAGLPVVSTHVMGIPELVKDGVTGLLVAPGRVDELADSLARLAAEPALRARMGDAGRARVVGEFGLDAAAARLTELFEATVLVKTRGRPAPAPTEREPEPAAA